MPRVVPSQIVDLIARTKVRGLRAPAMSAIVDLANELPDEFVVLSGDDYSDYRVSINTVSDLLDRWKSGRGNAQWVAECSTALEAIQNLLSKCPDEIPSPLTAELIFSHASIALRALESRHCFGRRCGRSSFALGHYREKDAGRNRGYPSGGYFRGLSGPQRLGSGRVHQSR
jgi:hypothetical protein